MQNKNFSESDNMNKKTLTKNVFLVLLSMLIITIFLSYFWRSTAIPLIIILNSLLGVCIVLHIIEYKKSKKDSPKNFTIT
jgi:predicted RND superfamily exporter protein